MNILLTSVGRRTYLIDYFKEALDGKGKVFASNSVMTYSLTQADEYTLTPKIYDAEYIDYLINYCKDNKINAIISLFDIDLLMIAKNKKHFSENGIAVIVSDEDVIKVCNDKWATYNFFIDNDILTPITYIDINTVKQDLKLGKLQYPLILKPRWGMGSIGVFKANNIDELNIFYNRLKQDIFETYLKYESKQDDRCVVIQECINGNEYGLDVINDLEKKYQNTICKIKLEVRSGECMECVTVDNKEAVALGKKISQSLKHIANLDVDIFIENKKCYALEMNARFGGLYAYSQIAGANLPKQILLWLQGGDTDHNLVNAKTGVKGFKDIKPEVFIQNYGG